MIDYPETKNLPDDSNPLACEPVTYLSMDAEKQPKEGTALCLSGGGYRAMLFHTGVVLRLNETGLLRKLARISSVSGGSITAGVLAMKWSKLNFQDDVATNFVEEIVRPIKSLASRTIDVSSVLTGSMWFGSIGDKLANAYRDYLFGEATLQDIPDEPRFVFNATNVQSGALWRFMKPYMRDYRVGEVKNPRIQLAVVVAASSAFPPVLSPVELDLDPGEFTPDSGTDLQGNEFRTQVVLTDGGVYDNLGLETVWKNYRTVLVSDAGGGFAADADPHRDWVRHSVRVLLTIDNQVRNLRKRQIVESFLSKVRRGAYWSISGNLSNSEVVSALNCPFDRTSLLAAVDTRLKKLNESTQDKWINWGYASCDNGLRRFVDSSFSAPVGFPYPEVGV